MGGFLIQHFNALIIKYHLKGVLHIKNAEKLLFKKNSPPHFFLLSNFSTLHFVFFIICYFCTRFISLVTLYSHIYGSCVYFIRVSTLHSLSDLRT